MFNTSLPNSLPKPGACCNLNILHPWFQRNEVEVTLADNTVERTVHILSDGRQFDFRKAFGTNEGWKYIYIRELSYLDEDGNHQIIKVSPRNPHLINRVGGVTNVGYVTKVNGLRWGVNIFLDWQSGVTQIVADEESPITGCMFQLIE